MVSSYRERGVLDIGLAMRSRKEEAASAITHGIGLGVSLLGSGVLMAKVWQTESQLLFIACLFYCTALMGVFAASTLSHLYFPQKWNARFRSLDQGFIYLLVVGTIAPFVVSVEPGPIWLAALLGLIGIALFGFISKTLLTHRIHDVTLYLYLVLGWGQVILFGPLLLSLPWECVAWIVAGGVAYTVGYVFLWADVRHLHFHAIWHILVMIGGLCHFLGVMHAVSMA